MSSLRSIDNIKEFARATGTVVGTKGSRTVVDPTPSPLHKWLKLFVVVALALAE